MNGHRLRAWIANTFGWWDFGIGAFAGLGTFLGVTHWGQLLRGGRAILITEAALSVALLAVVLTALSILVVFLGEDYVTLLQATKEGVAGAIRPYKVVGIVSGLACGAAFIGILTWPVALPITRKIVLAVVTGLAAWALAGTVDLLLRTAWHGNLRARLPEIREAGRRAWEERKKTSA